MWNIFISLDSFRVDIKVETQVKTHSSSDKRVSDRQLCDGLWLWVSPWTNVQCTFYCARRSFLPQSTFSLYISGTSTQNKYRPFWFRSLQLPLNALTSLIAALLKSQSGKTFGLMNLAKLRWRAARPQIITLQNAPDNWIDKLNITNAEWGLGLHGFL